MAWRHLEHRERAAFARRAGVVAGATLDRDMRRRSLDWPEAATVRLDAEGRRTIPVTRKKDPEEARKRSANCAHGRGWDGAGEMHYDIAELLPDPLRPA
jgi:hypothetical protein